MEWVAAFGALAFVAALQARALGVCIVGAVALATVYPSVELAGVIVALCGVAAVLAAFRD